MNATASILSRQQTRAGQHPHPLLAVVTWEIRRFFSSRTTWWVLPLTFGLLLFITWLLWLSKVAGTTGFGNGATFTTFSVALTSAQGMILILPTLSTLLALILPFVNTDGIARDLKQRTHELLMSTPLPTWAYAWGRYAACVLLSLGLAVLVLVSLLLMGLILHQTQTNYPLPQFDAVAIIWAVALVPTTILVSSVSFGLGTIVQRYSNLVKMGILLGWFVCAFVLPVIPTAGAGHVPTWYLSWEPTNNGMAALLQAPYTQGTAQILNDAARGGGDHATLVALTNLEQQMPNLGGWILPHLVWALLGLAVVVAAALTFRRFRNANN